MEVLLDTNGLPWRPKRMGVGGTFVPSRRGAWKAKV